MRRAAILSLLMCALTAVEPPTTEAAVPRAHVPHTIVQSIAMKGLSSAHAVVYRHNGVRLGVVVGTGVSQNLIWSRPLPAVPQRLFSPGPRGLLDGIIRFEGSDKAVVFAYLVRPTHVSSAIPGNSSGDVMAPEGASFHGSSFTLRDPDTGHVGSVKYRFDSTYAWGQDSYALARRVEVPDYADSAYPRPSATVTTPAGNIVLLRLEVSDTVSLRDTGLMNRTALDPDSGMIFVWTHTVLDSFWMQDTFIPLSIAFLSPDGTVQEIQDMAPLTTTFHTPKLLYQYAIEANVAYFKAEGIQVGDTMSLHLAP